MIAVEKQTEVKQIAEQLYAHKPDWVTFYREIMGVNGIAHQMFPGRQEFAAFEQSPAYQEILQLLTKLRQLPGPSADAAIRRRRTRSRPASSRCGCPGVCTRRCGPRRTSIAPA